MLCYIRVALQLHVLRGIGAEAHLKYYCGWILLYLTPQNFVNIKIEPILLCNYTTLQPYLFSYTFSYIFFHILSYILLCLLLCLFLCILSYLFLWYTSMSLILCVTYSLSHKQIKLHAKDVFFVKNCSKNTCAAKYIIIGGIFFSSVFFLMCVCVYVYKCTYGKLWHIYTKSNWLYLLSNFLHLFSCMAWKSHGMKIERRPRIIFHFWTF